MFAGKWWESENVKHYSEASVSFTESFNAFLTGDLISFYGEQSSFAFAFFLKEIAGEKWERREEFEEAEIWRKGEWDQKMWIIGIVSSDY